MVDPKAMTEPVMSNCVVSFVQDRVYVSTCDILGNTSEGEDQSRSDRDEEDSSDLLISSAPKGHMLLTLRAKAIPALVKRTSSPTLCRA